MIGRTSLVRAMFATALLAAALPAAGQQSITVSGHPDVMTVRYAFAGQSPEVVTDLTTTYSMQVDSTSRVVARLDQAFPEGVTLTLRLEEPMGATSWGPVVLTTLDQEVVSTIASGDYSGLEIRYELTAPTEAGTIALDDRTVVLTLVEG